VGGRGIRVGGGRRRKKEKEAAENKNSGTILYAGI
jgi:hypothetical protein